MFDVQNVSLSYGERVVLRNASFKIEDGERAAIIGANGTGKSTLLKIIFGGISPDAGSVSIPKGYDIGYLPQDIELDSNLSILDECRSVFKDLLAHEQEMRQIEHQMNEVEHESAEYEKICDRYGYLLHETQRRDLYSMDATVGRVLDGLGFVNSDLQRPCDSFSGGWQMRICLAKILLQNPDVLLLDEPTNHLDIESIQWLTEWLQNHQGSLLMVSHERSFMDALCKKVIEIDRSNVVVYRGNYSQAKVKRAERREIQQRTYENQQKEIIQLQRFIDRFRYQAAKAALVQSRVKQLEKLDLIEAPANDAGTITFKFPPAPRSAKEVLTITGVDKAYGDLEVIKDANFTIYRGEKVALVGVNGAGKSTLMRILAQRDTDYTGENLIGNSVDMAYFAQYDREDLHPDNSVHGEFLSSAPLSVSDKARAILGAFLFSGEDVQKKIKVLSGGERTRLRLAKMLCGKANLLLLDEPTNHLDVGSRLTLEESLRQYDGAVVLVSHDRYFLDNVVNRVIEVSDTKVTCFPGGYEEYLAYKEARDLQKKKETASSKASSDKPEKAPPPVVISVAEKETPEVRAERQARQKQTNNRLRKIKKDLETHEKQITELDIKNTQLEEQLADPRNSSDFNKLQDLTKILKSQSKEKESSELIWLELQEEQEELENLTK